MNTPAPSVALVGVTKRFPGVVALDDVSLTFTAGEVHVLLGENGAGKSTLVGLLSGLVVPDKGHLAVDGKPTLIANPGAALTFGIATVFQHPMLVPSLTVAENLALSGAIWRRPNMELRRARIRTLCAQLGFSLDPDARIADLSLGEQQQADIVRALFRGRRLLIFDEATSMLPPNEAQELGRVMREMAARGVAVLFITHKLTEALVFADRVSVLRRGRHVGEIPPARLAEARAGGQTSLPDEIMQMMFGSGLHADTEPPPRRKRTPSDAAMLRFCDVTVEHAQVPLHGIDLDVAAGEIVGIAGIDGNGQLQLAEAAAGQIELTAGLILLDGQDVQSLPPGERRRLGLRYVSDDRLHEGSIGAFPVSLNLLLKSVGEAPFWKCCVEQSDAIRRHAEALVAAFDVRTPSLETPIGKLSGGNIQKTILAREFHGAPKAIVFAKPTNGLDVQNALATRARIREAASAGIAIMLFSADLEEIFALSHRVGVMQAGRLVRVVDNGPGARRDVAALMSGGQA